MEENAGDDVLGGLEEREGPPGDLYQVEAVEGLTKLFETNRQRVFFSRQLEVQHENRWFHWVTNRAVRSLIDDGLIRAEEREMATRGRVTLLWHRSHRYYRRDASRVLSLVEEYANPNIGAAIGLHGEFMVLEAFARQRFILAHREARTFGSRTWSASEHDLDFIFEADGEAYGVEVKNQLGYMDHGELVVKIALCQALGVRPVFAVRMLPKSWVNEVAVAGGFALIFKHQLYPWTHRDLARRVRDELGLPVDAPRAIAQGTMDRFMRWASAHA